MTIVLRDLTKQLCVYIDTFAEIQRGIFTQVPPEDFLRYQIYYLHKFLTFISGRITGLELVQSTPESISFAMMETSEQLHWIFATLDGPVLYKDHENLSFLFKPVSMPNLSQTPILRVLRWVVKPRAKSYCSLYTSGTEEV